MVQSAEGLGDRVARWCSLASGRKAGADTLPIAHIRTADGKPGQRLLRQNPIDSAVAARPQNSRVRRLHRTEPESPSEPMRRNRRIRECRSGQVPSHCLDDRPVSNRAGCLSRREKSDGEVRHGDAQGSPVTASGRYAGPVWRQLVDDQTEVRTAVAELAALLDHNYVTIEVRDVLFVIGTQCFAQRNGVIAVTHVL